MMWRKSGLVLCLAGGLALAVPAAAQTPVKYTFTPQIGAAVPASDLPASFRVDGVNEALVDREFDPSMLYGAAMGLRLVEAFGVEGTFGWSPANLVSIPGDEAVIDVNLFNWGLTGMLFVPNERLEPYLALGIGGKTYDWDIADANAETDLAVHFGGGMEYIFRPNAALRLDIRDYVSRFNPEVQGVDKETQHDLLMQVGVTFSTARRGERVAARR